VVDSVYKPGSFKPFTDDQLAELDDRFQVIEVYTPSPRPRSRWSRSTTEPEPPFSLVFRAATPDEWAFIRRQLNDPRQKPNASYNLAKATIVAVSFGGEHVIHDGAPGTPPNDSRASKGPRDAFDRILRTPGFAGVAEDLADKLAELNGVNATEVEKE
jgi:hypothetical protein